MRPTKVDQLEAVVRMRSSEPAVVTWLQDRLEEHKEALVSQGDPMLLKQIQGRAQELRELLLHIQQAHEYLEIQRRAPRKAPV